jgi:hypothetical protein
MGHRAAVYNECLGVFDWAVNNTDALTDKAAGDRLGVALVQLAAKCEY